MPLLHKWWKSFLGVARWSQGKHDGTPKPKAIEKFQEFCSADLTCRLVEYVGMEEKESHSDTLWFLFTLDVTNDLMCMVTVYIWSSHNNL